MTQQEQYWKNRCEAAEKYIKESPCDPDITVEQIKAYAEWRDLSRIEPPAPAQGVDEAELRQLFKNNSDCYADTWSQDGLGAPMIEGDVIQAITEERFIEVVAPIIGSRWQQGQQPTPAIGARWVKGEYDRLYHLGKSGKRIPCFVDHDWLRDGTQILRDIAILTPENMSIGAR